MMAEGGSCDVVCDLCEDEPAVSFCDECHCKVCTFCHALHVRQKQTKVHNLTTIEKVKLLLLNVKCSFCGGQAERFCSECNVRLCTKCAMSHHKLCDIRESPTQASGDRASDGQVITATYVGLDQTTNLKENSNKGLSHDSSKTLVKDSVPQRSTIIVKDMPIQSHVLCDLCEEEIAACFCENCQKQMCAFCQQGHIKQKQTKYHKLSAIEKNKRSILHTICSSCNQHAEKVCIQCEVCFCTKCSDAHHNLTDTLMPRKQISSTEFECGDQVSGRHFSPGSLVYKSEIMNKTLLPPDSGRNQDGFHQVADQEYDSHGEVSGRIRKNKGRLAEDGSDKCVNDKRCQASDFRFSQLNLFREGHDKHMEVNGPGKIFVKHVSWDSVDIEWDAVASYCNGDVYQVRIENTKSRKWNFQNFETNSGKIMGLEPGTSYIFKVRLVKSDGEESKYGETSKEVETLLEQDLPGKPCFKDISSDSVDIEWGTVRRRSKGDIYQVRIENTKDGKWHCLNFETSSCKISDLQPSTSYTFKVRLVKGKGEEGKYGETSEEIWTKKELIPGKPSVKLVFGDRVDLIWQRVDTFCRGDVYEVHAENLQTKETTCQKFDTNCVTIKDLQPDSPYIFKVRLVSQKGKLSKFSDNSDRVTTSPTFASKLIHTQCRVEKTHKGPTLYELPLVEVRHATNEDAMSFKYDIGPKGKDVIVEKTIMLVGETGAGKNTFVDSLANYVLGVRLKDPYRFTVTRKEDREKQKNKAISQTDWIKTYSFNPQEGARLTYTLNVIDTPGFGDTRGLNRDKEIIDQIHKLFKAPGEKGVQTIDAVCFFLKAADSRLTEAQSYIFKAIQSIFGKYIKENICLLITFFDGSEPVVLDAVKESGMPYGNRFCFNNLPWSSDPEESTTSVFWNISTNSFEALFDHLKTLESKSSQLTKEVLKERQRLEGTCQNLQIHIRDTLLVMDSFKKEMNIFQENIDEINANKNITYTVEEVKLINVDLPLNQRATNCLKCKSTCHSNCSSLFEHFPRTCWAFSWITGYCNQCNCHSSSHKTSGYRFDTCMVTVTKTYTDMRQRFQDATQKLLTVNEVLEKMKRQQEAYIFKTKEMFYNMLLCKNRLNEIALCPGQLNINEYIEQLIDAEKTERQPGFQNRIEQLTYFREEARLLERS